jgi:hypothetical protein
MPHVCWASQWCCLSLLSVEARAPEFIPGFLVGSVLLIFVFFCVVLIFVFMFRVPCYNVCCDIRIKTMFDSYLPPVVCVFSTLFVSVSMWLCSTHIVLCFWFVWLRSVFCVPSVPGFSGLFISECPFGII